VGYEIEINGNDGRVQLCHKAGCGICDGMCKAASAVKHKARLAVHECYALTAPVPGDRFEYRTRRRVRTTSVDSCLWLTQRGEATSETPLRHSPAVVDSHTRRVHVSEQVHRISLMC